MSPKSIDEIVTESRVKGHEKAVVEQLTLWSKGEITESEFRQRKAAIDRAHLEWAKGAEARGWKATPQERREASQALQAAKREQAKQEVYELLPAFERGEISRAELKESKDVIERRYLEGYRRRYAAPPQDIELIKSYKVKRVLQEQRTPESIGQGTEIRHTRPQRVEPGTVWIEVPLSPKEREAEYQRQYAAVLKLAKGQPVTFDPKTQTFSWFEVQEPELLLDAPEWSRYRGAKPGSFAHEIQQKTSAIFQDMETGFRGLTKPLEKNIAERETKSLELAAKGKPWAGFGAYMASVGSYALYTGFEAFTFPLRPIRVAETVSGVVALATVAEARKQFVRTVAKDPFKFAVGVGGSVAGGYAFGRAASKVADVTIGKPKPIKEYVTTERTITRPRTITKTVKTKAVIVKDSDKVLRTRVTGWDKIPVEEELGTGFLARHQVRTGGKWPKSGVKGFGMETTGHDVILTPRQVFKPTGYVYKPRVETTYGFKKVSVPQVVRITRPSIVSRVVPQFNVVTKTVKDLTPGIFAKLGAATGVIPISHEYSPLEPTREKLTQAVKLKDIQIAHPRYEQLTREKQVYETKYTYKVEPMLVQRVGSTLISKPMFMVEQDAITKQKAKQMLTQVQISITQRAREEKRFVPLIRQFERTGTRQRKVRIHIPRLVEADKGDYLKNLFAGEFRGYKMKGPKEILELI